MTADASLDVPAPASTGREVAPVAVLRTEGLTIRFGGLTALDNVNFEIQHGEIRAIIGPNGAGKSTFFNCLTGVLRPSAGRILFNGDDITGLPPDRISQKGIARSYQITNILPNATTLENVRIAAQSPARPEHVHPPQRLSDILDKAEAVLESVGLRDKADELAAISRTAAAQPREGIALATEPQLLPRRADRRYERASETHGTMEPVRRIAKNLTI
jgi:branched-chain amino acid transport system ATP-binding protein